MAKKLTRPILLIEGGMHDADLRHVSGFTAPDPVVLLIDGRRKFLVVSLLEFGRAKTTAHVTETLTPQQLGLEGRALGRISEWAVALLKRERRRSVMVGASFPIGTADRLREAGIRVTVSDGDLFPARRRKTPAEIRHITVTQRAAVHAMKAAMTLIAQASVGARGYLLGPAGRPLRSEDVRREIDRVLLDRDCMAQDTIVAGGAQGADPHERGHGPLRAGQPIVIDIFPRHKVSGYWGDLTRTIVKGAPKPDVLRMYRAVCAAQQAALGAVRAGVTVKRVHATAQRVLQEHGFETTVKNGWGEGFIHSTGHGIGLEIHEAPSLNRSETRLLAGDVVTVEPGLYYKRFGGVRIEDTVVVTRNGYRLLAACPLRFAG